MSIATIREALATQIEAVSGVSYAPDIMPTKIPNDKLAAVTVYFAGFKQDRMNTGGSLTDNTWRFRVDIYIAAQNQSNAIATLETIISGILTSFRANSNLSNTVDFVNVVDGGDPDLLMSGEGNSIPLLFKTLSIEVRTEEG